MAWKIARTTEYVTIAVVVVLAGTCLWTNWGITPEDVTGSIARPPAGAMVSKRPPPVINAAASVPAPSRAPQINLVAHVIEPRETMKSIALRFDTRVADIATVNRIAADTKLKPGEILVVPVYR